MPAAKPRPKARRPAWITARATRLAARASAAARRAGSRRGLSSSKSRRRTASGETRRTARSGRSEKTTATQTPTPTPPRTAGQESDQDTSTGSRSLEEAGERHLDGGAQGRADEAAEEAEHHRLDEVGREDRPAGRAQAAQDGHRGEAALDEDVDGARDAEAAEEEGHEGDEAEEVPEVRERLAQAPLVLGDGADVQALGGEARAEAVGDLLGVGPGRQAQVGLVARARAPGEEAGLRRPASGG